MKGPNPNIFTNASNGNCQRRHLGALASTHRTICPLAVVRPVCTSLDRIRPGLRSCLVPSGGSYTTVRAARTDGGAADLSYEDYEEEIGPAFQATLDLLDWPQLCSYLSEFASTAVGKRRCRELSVPELQPVTEQLQRETRYGSCDFKARVRMGDPDAHSKNHRII
jgi:hypothetical protein